MGAIGGKLPRDNRTAAASLTRALPEASSRVDQHNELAVEAAQFHSPWQVIPQESGEMIAGYPYDEHHDAPVGEEFHRHVLFTAQALKETGVLKPGTGPVRFTNHVTLDVLTS